MKKDTDKYKDLHRVMYEVNTDIKRIQIEAFLLKKVTALANSKIMKPIIFLFTRILPFPFIVTALALFYLWQLLWCSLCWFLYGGEIIPYTKGDRKLIFDVFDRVKHGIISAPKSILELEYERFIWSLKTFPEATAISSLRKLESEIKEIESDIATGNKNPMEYADALMCLFDSAGRQGIPASEIFTAFGEKLEINKKRVWIKNPDNSYSHVNPPTDNPFEVISRDPSAKWGKLVIADHILLKPFPDNFIMFLSPYQREVIDQWFVILLEKGEKPLWRRPNGNVSVLTNKLDSNVEASDRHIEFEDYFQHVKISNNPLNQY